MPHSQGFSNNSYPIWIFIHPGSQVMPLPNDRNVPVRFLALSGIDIYWKIIPPKFRTRCSCPIDPCSASVSQCGPDLATSTTGHYFVNLL